MPLWGNQDNAANSDIAATIQVNQATTPGNRANLYGNVTMSAITTNLAIGQFAVDTNEARANPAIPHSGWVLRKEGTGLRAGRVTYEVLVATGSIATDGSDDTNFPDFTLRITTQPTSANGAGNVNLTVAAASTPTGATLSYTWQRNAGAGWVSVPNTAGVYFNNTSPTLVANAAVANANTFRVLVSAAGANTVTSANAAVTTP
jgi:hypothetical protein